MGMCEKGREDRAFQICVRLADKRAAGPLPGSDFSWAFGPLWTRSERFDHVSLTAGVEEAPRSAPDRSIAI